MRQLASILVKVSLPALAAGSAWAGGPLAVDSSGQPFTWSTSSAIPYRTDGGRLSANVDNAQAQTRVRDMFDVWQDVASAIIRYTRAGAIQDVGAFVDGDVNTAVEFNAVEGACNDGSQNPIIYDVDGSLFEDLGQDSSVIGFAGPCAINGNGEIVSGHAVMNGTFQDGVDSGSNFELTAAEFDAAFVHEFGHFSGLDHSQVNVECLSASCTGDRLAGLPTMFPFLVSAEQGSLSTDDSAWISRLYPAPGGAGFEATHGNITGNVYFSDGESQVQGVNVIARRVDDPLTVGVDESLSVAASNVSGYRFRFFLGNPITNPAPSAFGATNPALIGLYEISVPPGDYTVEVETINPAFVDGSSVGGPVLLPMPGLAPQPVSVNVTAGQTVSADDLVLISTPPRFDVFEGS